MFSGIVSEVGEVSALADNLLTVRSPKNAPFLNESDSVAVNGVCLTVIARTNETFQVEMIAETLRLTNLAELAVGSRVNLELPLKMGDPIGGHMVYGHVEGTGALESVNLTSPKAIKVGANSDIIKYVKPKGFIAIDGVSLTITEVRGHAFGVALTSYTTQHTIIREYAVGREVNLETDMLLRRGE